MLHSNTAGAPKQSRKRQPADEGGVSLQIGYYFSAFTVDKSWMGRVRLQSMVSIALQTTTTERMLSLPILHCHCLSCTARAVSAVVDGQS